MASIVILIGGIAAYGKFQAKDKEKELRIKYLEKAEEEKQTIISKVFDRLEYMQRDLTAIRLEMKDKQNRI